MSGFGYWVPLLVSCRTNQQLWPDDCCKNRASIQGDGASNLFHVKGTISHTQTHTLNATSQNCSQACCISKTHQPTASSINTQESFTDSCLRARSELPVWLVFKQVFSTFSLQPVGATHLLCIRDTFQGTWEIKVQPPKSSVPDSETVHMWHLRDGTDWPQDETKSLTISRDFIYTTAQTANPHKRQDIRLFSRRNLGGNNSLCCL